VSTHAVTLERPVVRLDGNQVSSSDSPLFELNADDLTSTVALDELAHWLQDHPEVVLLRVEGHADPLGSSAYNYDLSVRRAEGVHAILVARGVDPARLQVIGSGEAWSGDGPVRQVAFTVIVWAD
jgi:outer membrane protein OmpA-like peptidoglycan-associated protein